MYEQGIIYNMIRLGKLNDCRNGSKSGKDHEDIMLPDRSISSNRSNDRIITLPNRSSSSNRGNERGVKIQPIKNYDKR